MLGAQPSQIPYLGHFQAFHAALEGITLHPLSDCAWHAVCHLSPLRTLKNALKAKKALRTFSCRRRCSHATFGAHHRTTSSSSPACSRPQLAPAKPSFAPCPSPNPSPPLPAPAAAWRSTGFVVPFMVASWLPDCFPAALIACSPDFSCAERPLT